MPDEKKKKLNIFKFFNKKATNLQIIISVRYICLLTSNKQT